MDTYNVPHIINTLNSHLWVPCWETFYRANTRTCEDPSAKMYEYNSQGRIQWCEVYWRGSTPCLSRTHTHNLQMEQVSVTANTKCISRLISNYSFLGGSTYSLLGLEALREHKLPPMPLGYWLTVIQFCFCRSVNLNRKKIKSPYSFRYPSGDAPSPPNIHRQSSYSKHSESVTLHHGLIVIYIATRI